jgi:hypothetical protein
MCDGPIESTAIVVPDNNMVTDLNVLQGNNDVHLVVRRIGGRRVGTRAQSTDDEQNQTDDYLLFHGGYSGAPPVFGRLMVVVDEPLDMGASGPPARV